ncbi:hypothetical protein DL96DRAFT_1276371 [Flagelloscypha sp. PMI_526]|nr:hypothetical protein DL96DRAFT_1276371 [Flagelloscypha sp. PMI_526]
MPDVTYGEEEGDGKLLLSLDAGSLDNPNIASQLHVLDDILHQYAHDNNLDGGQAKAHQVFDMIVGTGSGGLVAAMLGPLEMTIQEALEALDNLRRVTFDPPISWGIRLIDTLAHIPRKLRSSDTSLAAQILRDRLTLALQQLIERQLEHDKIGLPIQQVEGSLQGCYFAITAMTQKNVGPPTVFCGYRSRHRSPDCTLLDALRATMAEAPVFPSVKIGKPHPQKYIGAHVGHSNPIETILQQAGDKFRDQSISAILSIGPGTPGIIDLEAFNSSSKEIMKLVSSSQPAAERASARFSHHPEAYYRFDVDQLHSPHSASPATAKADSESYLKRFEVEQRINELVEVMRSKQQTIHVEDVGRPKPGAVRRALENAGSLVLHRLPYPDRASYNPDYVCLNGTREDILGKIEQWMMDKQRKHSMVWLEAGFGAGKSFVAHSVAAKADKLKILGSSFFMTPGTSIREDVDRRPDVGEPPSLRNIITSLIVDLGSQCDKFRYRADTILKLRRNLMTAAPSAQLTYLLLPSLRYLNKNRTFVWVIDGFDELMRDSDREAAHCFFDSLWSSLPEFPSHLIVFITSRPLHNRHVSSTSSIDLLHLDLLSQKNTEDLGLIADAELKKLERRNRTFSDPGPEICKKFRNKASGHPLWLKVVREYLAKSLEPNKELKRLLELGGEGGSDFRQFMDSTYAEVIKRSIDLSRETNRKALKHVILLLLSLEQPLPLSTILDILQGSEEITPETFNSVGLHLSPLFLGFNSSNDSNPLEFIHLSLRDFFKSSTSFSDLIQDVPPPRDFSFAHSALLECSFQIMETYLPEVLAGCSNPHNPPALTYAVGAWTHHIKSLDVTSHVPRLAALLSNFMEKSFIAWLDYHISINLSFLFTKEFLKTAKHFVDNVWNKKVLSRRQTAEKLDMLRSQLVETKRFNDWQLCSDQAVDLWRGLAELDAGDCRRLYLSLEDMAVGFRKFDRANDALASFQAALDVCRSVHQEGSQGSTSEDLSRLLTEVSAGLSKVGRHAEALEATNEAVSLLRMLAQKNPKVFNADLAHSLTNLSLDLSKVDRHEEALNATYRVYTRSI